MNLDHWIGFAWLELEWTTVRPGLFALSAVETMIPLQTKSTGIKSAILSTFVYTYFNTPLPPATLNPPAAESVSVHPGNGSLTDALIIAGLKITQGKLAGLLFFKVLSAIDLVKVYVLGQGPRIWANFASYSSGAIFMILAITSSESSGIS